MSVIRAGQPQAYLCGTAPGCLAFDPASQSVDQGETGRSAEFGIAPGESPPAGGSPGKAEEAELQTSRVVPGDGS